jgi:hypothetical protein
MMHGQEKSDSSIVAKKLVNKSRQLDAELVEPREGAKGNTGRQRTHRTQRRVSVSQRLDRVRQAARQRKKERFTALFHRIDIEMLEAAYFWLKRKAASGIDGLTWEDYEVNWEHNLQDLHRRLHRQSYRALPTRRQYIPKLDGRMRPLGKR